MGIVIKYFRFRFPRCLLEIMTIYTFISMTCISCEGNLLPLVPRKGGRWVLCQMAKSTGERESASITADLIATTVGTSRPGRFWNPLERTVSRWSSPARDLGVCSLSRLQDCGLAATRVEFGKRWQQWGREITWEAYSPPPPHTREYQLITC